MQRWNGLDAIPGGFGPCVVTIGVFDGVHRGHAALITRAVHAARERGVPCVVMTFDPHPLAVLAPDRAPAMLATLDHRLDLIAELGADASLVLAFTPGLAELSPEAFVRTILVDRVQAELVVVGANFTFGRGGAGTVADMARLGTDDGLDVDAVALIGPDDAAHGRPRDTAHDPSHGGSHAPGGSPANGAVSASRIRALLLDGEVEQVAALLGRPFRADGVIVRGEQRGRALGYPTANLDLAVNAAVPADGIYAGRVRRLKAHGPEGPDGTHQSHTELGIGAISVGTNPTFDGQHRTVEAFILDFDADLYGDVLGVEFAHRLRGMVRFDSIDELILQMDADVIQARELLGG